MERLLNRHRVWSGLFLGVLLLLGTAGAQPQYEAMFEAFGPLKLGQSDSYITGQLGPPGRRSEAHFEGATGLNICEWHYPKQGLVLTMGREQAADPWKLERLRATHPCSFKTGHGIGLGSTSAQVRKAYTINPEDSQGDHLVVGSVYGGLIFTLSKGKVSEIFIGAAAE